MKILRCAEEIEDLGDVSVHKCGDVIYLYRKQLETGNELIMGCCYTCETIDLIVDTDLQSFFPKATENMVRDCFDGKTNGPMLNHETIQRMHAYLCQYLEIAMSNLSSKDLN